MKSEAKATVALILSLLAAFLLNGLPAIGGWIISYFIVRLVYWIAWRSGKTVPPMILAYGLAAVLSASLWTLGEAGMGDPAISRFLHGLWMYGSVLVCWAAADWYIQRLPIEQLKPSTLQYSPTLMAKRRASAAS